MFIHSSIEKELSDNGELVYTNAGNSMFPLIWKKGDIIVIKKVSPPYKKYDVILYKRRNGRYIMHRIVKVDKDGSYVTCGDNRCIKEYGIVDEDVLGVLTKIVRNNKELLLDETKYKLFAFVWTKLYFARKIFFVLKAAIKKLKFMGK